VIKLSSAGRLLLLGLTLVVGACTPANIPPSGSYAPVQSDAVLPPSPPYPVSPCPPAAGQVDLLLSLRHIGVNTTSMGWSTAQDLYGPEAVACVMQTDTTAPFEAVFFKDQSAAAAFRVCETSSSGGRYLYRMSTMRATSPPVDSSYRWYWTVQGNVVLVVDSPGLEARFKRALGGTTPPCWREAGPPKYGSFAGCLRMAAPYHPL
jgi:hypothetical protein